jgi:hypothetical protein
METIDDYLNAAITRQHFTSDRELSARLGLAAVAVSNYRTKRCWPAEETMATLAELAGLDARLALLHLATWRAKSSRIRELYSSLARRASSAVIIAAVACGLLPAPAQASGTRAEQIAPQITSPIHYAIFGRHRPGRSAIPSTKNPAPPSIADEPWAHAFTT